MRETCLATREETKETGGERGMGTGGEEVSSLHETEIRTHTHTGT